MSQKEESRSKYDVLVEINLKTEERAIFLKNALKAMCDKYNQEKEINHQLKQENQHLCVKIQQMERFIKSNNLQFEYNEKKIQFQQPEYKRATDQQQNNEQEEIQASFQRKQSISRQKNVKDQTYITNVSKSVVAVGYQPKISTSNIINEEFNQEFVDEINEDISFKNLRDLPQIHFVSMVNQKVQEKKDNQIINKQVNHNQKERLYEEFFVFGVERNDIEQFEKNYPDEIEGNLDAKILWNYPNDVNRQSSWSKVVQDFVFPFGVNIEKINVKNSFSQIQQIIFQQNISEQNSQSFVFAIKSDKSYEKFSSETNPVLCGSNPNRVLYGTCFYTRDFFETTDKNIKYDSKSRKLRKIWEVPKVFCFLSYHPFMQLFIDIIVALLNILKLKRIQKYSENQSQEQDIYCKIDSDFMIYNLSREKHILYSILQYDSIKFGNLVCFPQFSETNPISFQIPYQQDISVLEGKWGAPVLFSTMSFDDFFFILHAMMLENSVVFVSKNVSLLTSSILTFYSMIKPFQWPHPMVFNLPEHLQGLFGSPVPILVGINRFHLDYQNCIFVSLDDNIEILISNEMMNDITNSLPSMNNELSKIKNYYESINPQQSKIFNKKKQSIFSKSYFDKELIYRKELQNAKQDELQLCIKILKALKENFQATIINRIPTNPKYIEDQQIDFKYIESQMMKGHKNDNSFLSKFIQTQIFTFFLEQFYGVN